MGPRRGALRRAGGRRPIPWDRSRVGPGAGGGAPHPECAKCHFKMAHFMFCEFYFNNKKTTINGEQSSLPPLPLTAWTQGPRPWPLPLGCEGTDPALRDRMLHRHPSSTRATGQMGPGEGQGKDPPSLSQSQVCHGPRRTRPSLQLDSPCGGTTPLPTEVRTLVPGPAHVECVTSRGERDLAGVSQCRTLRWEMTLVIWGNPKRSRRSSRRRGGLASRCGPPAGSAQGAPVRLLCRNPSH